MTQKSKIDCYPWAVPTEKQMHMFDALTDEEQLKMLQDALAEGEESGVSDKTIDDYLMK